MSEDVFEPVTGSRLYELVVEQILRLIATGEIPPGARLPVERDLAERFGVSRNVLREAIRVLEVRGIVRSRPGGGRYVRDANISARLSPVGVILRLERAAILDVLESREMLEVQVARLAARKVAEGADGQPLLEAARVSSGSWEDNARFHTAIAAATGNFMVERLVRLQLDLLRDVRQRDHYSTREARAGLAEHRAIATAISGGDQDAAEAALRAHFAHTRANVEQGA
ncbi:FadR/GntR family transcriptional regulator [Fodinicola feengrottensis]|uniref:FadR/GntR family transcriptional regulator n=1 Tax=Fodinicola feengrottensis TaxID=435914 RepID=UPI0031E01513